MALPVDLGSELVRLGIGRSYLQELRAQDEQNHERELPNHFTRIKY